MFSTAPGVQRGTQDRGRSVESSHHACSDTETTLPGAHLVTHVGANEQVREVGLPSTCCLESVHKRAF